MENKLNKLFDYQKFEKNISLERMIRETINRFDRALSDDDLFQVSAAGEVGTTQTFETEKNTTKQYEHNIYENTINDFGKNNND